MGVANWGWMSAVQDRARHRLQAEPHTPATQRWKIWRSPPDQPSWARPTLLLIAVLAGVAYAWGTGFTDVEPFYGAAARSMSGSLHDFLFGAVDPAGTITVDKLPGALWLQALSLSLLGFHIWALLLPQALEGALTVLVLYRAVRRLAGSEAAIVAAAVIALTPVTVTLNRGNVSDSLLILLTVLAADAASAAIVSGRLRSLLLAAVWIGLAFQAKMLQAWLVLPALGIAYLVAAPPSLPQRLRHLALAAALTIAVSLSWISAVSLVPASSRPYVDGTLDDSPFSQVFEYNGLARIGITSLTADAGPRAPFLGRLIERGDTLNAASAKIVPSWHRILSGLFGRDWGWLLPAALIAAAAVLIERRHTDRGDPLRALVLLWGTWLLVLGAVFSDGIYLNSYYLAALSPAVAALCGAGVAVFWRRRHSISARVTLAATLLAGAGYGAYLLQGGAQVPGWLEPVALGMSVAGAAGVLSLRWLRCSGPAARRTTAVVLACALPLTAVTSLLSVTRHLGPFAAPYQPVSDQPQRQAHRSTSQLIRAARAFTKALATSNHTQVPFAIDTSLEAAPFILYTGEEILPIGGYEGGAPAPTLPQIRRYIHTDEVRLFILPIRPATNDPRIVWLEAHCAETARLPMNGGVRFGAYYCPPGYVDLMAGVRERAP